MIIVKYLNEDVSDSVVTHSFGHGLRIVMMDDRFNVIKNDNTPIFPNWVDDVYVISDNFAAVMNDGKYNFINGEGVLLFKHWADDYAYASADRIVVCLNIPKNFQYRMFDLDGNEVFDEWDDVVTRMTSVSYDKDHHELPVRVRLGHEENYIDSSGKLISKRWYSTAFSFTDDGIARVMYDNSHYNTNWHIETKRYNYIDLSGNLISDTWYNRAGDFHDGAALVVKKNNYNFIDKSGKILLDPYPLAAHTFWDGWGRFFRDGKWNYVNCDGKLLSERGFDEASDFHCGTASVAYKDENGRLHTQYINSQGQVIKEYANTSECCDGGFPVDAPQGMGPVVIPGGPDRFDNIIAMPPIPKQKRKYKIKKRKK